MKFKIVMKDPDGVFESVRDAAWDSIESLGLEADEKSLVAEQRQERLDEMLEPWFEYSEVVWLEVDTDAGTIRVVPLSEIK